MNKLHIFDEEKKELVINDDTKRDMSSSEEVLVEMSVEDSNEKIMSVDDENEIVLEIDEAVLVVNDYNKLNNKPKINDVELFNNKTFEELGLLPMTNSDVDELFKSIFGS